MRELRHGGVSIAAHALPRGGATPWALASLALATVSGSLGTSIVNVALPSLTEHFGSTFASVQWVVIAYLLTGTAAIVLAGRLGDLLGQRRLLLTGLATFALASLAAGEAPTLGFLVGARAVQGGAAAVITALGLALARSAVRKERTGAAMGLLGTMSAVGTALGPSLGGALVEAFGWRAAFLANVPLALAALALGARFLDRDFPRQRSSPLEGLDVPGSILLTATLASLALSSTLGSITPGPWAAWAAALAVAGTVAFVLVERRSQAPLLPFALLRTGGLGIALASNGAVSTVMMATLIVGPFYLVRGLGLDASAAGLVMATGPLVSALVGIPAGRRVDAVGSRRVMLLGMYVLATGAALLASFAWRTSVVAYAAPLAVLTAGYALFQAANNTAVMSEVAAEDRGVVSGLLSLSRNLGLMLGATALGALFAACCGTSEIAHAAPEVVAGAMRVTFAVGAALVASLIAVVHFSGGARA